MDDDLKIDASGCWVRKNAHVISEIPLRSDIEQYNRLAYSFDVEGKADNEKQDEVLITW